MLSRQSGATKKYMLVEIEELIWVNVSAQRTQSLRICPMSELGQTRKYSLRADAFRCSSNNGHGAAPCKNHDLCTKRLTLILQVLMLCIIYVRNGERYGHLRI